MVKMVSVGLTPGLFEGETGIGLENRTQFLGVTFPNQTGFGLEKGTE